MANAAPLAAGGSRSFLEAVVTPENSSLPIATVGMPVTPRASASAVWPLSRSLLDLAARSPP